MYAGVQYGFECYCDNERPPDDRRIEESSCNMTCPGNEGGGGKCGGHLAMNVYQTGVKPVVEKKASNDTAGIK